MNEVLKRLSGNIVAGVVTALVLYIFVQAAGWLAGGAIIKMLGGVTATELQDFATKSELESLGDRLDEDDLKIIELIDTLTDGIDVRE